LDSTMQSEQYSRRSYYGTVYEEVAEYKKDQDLDDAVMSE